MNINHLSGLIAAPFTPMHADGSLNTSLISEYYKFLKKNKVTGAFICGSTGEGVSLTMQEKKEVTTAWADCTKDDKDFKVMLLTGGTCLADCIELAKYAQQAGIYAISFTAPFYFKPANAGMLARCCKEVAEAVPEMPFYYYHIPVLNGCNVSMIDNALNIHVYDVVHSNIGYEVISSIVHQKCIDTNVNEVIVEKNGVGVATVLMLHNLNFEKKYKLTPYHSKVNKEVKISTNYEFIKRHFSFDVNYKESKQYKLFISHLTMYSIEDNEPHTIDAMDVCASASRMIKVMYNKLI